MSSELIFIPAIKRRRRSRTESATSESPPLLPLMIVSVTDVVFFGNSGNLTVLFDVNAGYELVDPTSADPSQWGVVFNHSYFRGIDIEFDGGASLTINFEKYSSATGPNSLNYAADPPDIEDTQGRVLGAVVGYPL